MNLSPFLDFLNLLRNWNTIFNSPFRPMRNRRHFLQLLIIISILKDNFIILMQILEHIVESILHQFLSALQIVQEEIYLEAYFLLAQSLQFLEGDVQAYFFFQAFYLVRVFLEVLKHFLQNFSLIFLNQLELPFLLLRQKTILLLLHCDTKPAPYLFHFTLNKLNLVFFRFQSDITPPNSVFAAISQDLVFL